MELAEALMFIVIGLSVLVIVGGSVAWWVGRPNRGGVAPKTLGGDDQGLDYSNFLLRFVMRAWCARVAAGFHSIPRPDDTPRAHASGTDPDRLLLFGTGPVEGLGVASHQLALPGQLAREVSRITQRGSEVDVVIHWKYNVTSAQKSLRTDKLWSYDAILVVVGVYDAANLISTRRWRAAVRNLLRVIAASSSPHTRVVFAGIQPISSIPGFGGPLAVIADRHANRLNLISKQLCAVADRVAFVHLHTPVVPAGGRYRGPDAYLHWARSLASHLAPLLTSSVLAPDPARSTAETARAYRDRPQNAQERQRALDALRIVGTAPEERLDRIVNRAREAFGAEFAALSFVDQDREWFKTKSGFDASEAPKFASFCSHTIASAGPTVTGDARQDERFPENPFVTNDRGIRFYAGYPVESPDSYRVGALCVFDSTARDASDFNVAMLRDFAILAQQELWK